MSSRVVDIKEYWSPVIAETLEFKLIADAENPEFNYLWEKIYGIVDEYFVKSATEYGVGRMEKILKIVPPIGSTLNERKEQIIWKLNLKVPYTMRFLKNILAAMVGEENRFVDYNNDTRTVVVKIKEGVTDLLQLNRELKKIVPATLILDIGVM